MLRPTPRDVVDACPGLPVCAMASAPLSAVMSMAAPLTTTTGDRVLGI